MHAYFRYAAFGSYGLSRILPPPKSYCAGHCQNISQTSHLTKDRRRAIALRRSSPADAGLHKRENMMGSHLLPHAAETNVITDHKCKRGLIHSSGLHIQDSFLIAHRRSGRSCGSQMQTRSRSQFWSSYSRPLSYRTPPKRT